jgi:hypothetical protein
MMVGGGEQVEIVRADAVAQIQRAIYSQPNYMLDRPFEVEPRLWHQAEAELRHALELRGWPLLASDKAPLPNFLLCGVAVVMSND